MSVATARAQDVTVDFDKGVDFSQFKTYSWANGGVPAANPLIDRQIKASIEEQFAVRGVRRMDEGGDVTVLYFAAVDRDLQVAAGRWVTTGDWQRQTKSGMHVRSQMWDVEVGTLVVCVFDASGKKLLWRGTAKTMLDKRSQNRSVIEAMKEDARKVEKRVKSSVTKMFKQYPLAKASR
jgi:hypothetical protein